MIDPVQVVGEALRAHQVAQWVPDEGPHCTCGVELPLRKHGVDETEHQVPFIVAALQEAGALTAARPLAGYVVVTATDLMPGFFGLVEPVVDHYEERARERARVHGAGHHAAAVTLLPSEEPS